jgi:ribulose 1,5-bisphosphate carboxylase large subunit-like protein
MNWIRILISIVPVCNGGKVNPDDAHRLIDQIKNDALYGTYGTLDHEYWKSRMEFGPATLSEAEMLSDSSTSDGLRSYEFELRLSSSLFPPVMGGAPHLFGMLAGDLLRFTLPPFSLKDWRIKEIKFSDDWESAHFDSFRKSIANDIKSIRAAFGLRHGLPLLAFSFKPRVGFSIHGLEEVATNVLSAGFNIVELDTRHLPVDRRILKQLLDLACKLPDKFHKHVARLSLNLSMRTDIAMEAAETLCRNCPQPAILKIDGGFNGMSSVQSIRGKDIRDGRKLGPIITCYPLLQRALARYVPADHYVATLAASGVDIIYPGERPDIGGMVRSLDGAGERNHLRPVQRYIDLTKKGWPMLSIAGGIYPGQLQAFYELLGPDVAWFLGGGVALHRDGPRAGAALCVAIAQESAAKKAKAGNKWSEDLSEKLSEKADSMFNDRSMLSIDQLRYVSPRSHLSGVHGLAPYKR